MRDVNVFGRPLNCGQAQAKKKKLLTPFHNLSITINIYIYLVIYLDLLISIYEYR